MRSRSCITAKTFLISTSSRPESSHACRLGSIAWIAENQSYSSQLLLHRSTGTTMVYLSPEVVRELEERGGYKYNSTKLSQFGRVYHAYGDDW